MIESSCKTSTEAPAKDFADVLVIVVTSFIITTGIGKRGVDKSRMETVWCGKDIAVASNYSQAVETWIFFVLLFMSIEIINNYCSRRIICRLQKLSN